jgi:hypothetical protein
LYSVETQPVRLTNKSQKGHFVRESYESPKIAEYPPLTDVTGQTSDD